MIAGAILMCWATVSAPVLSHTIERLPRVVGRADVSLWRTASSGTMVFNHTQPLFVRASDAEAQRTLASVGVTAEIGSWVSAEFDGGALMTALASAGQLELRRAPAHRLMLDKSVAEIGALDVRQGSDIELPRDGTGVLVGVIDTGVDLTHPAFRDDQGRSRVIAVWDQDATEGRSPRGFSYGRECNRRTLLNDDCDIGDSRGHGTHVAGIAAGNQGVAPGADIAVVRSDTFTRLADAVLYLVELAEARGQPLVMNISVGGHYGPHDGRTPIEEYIGEQLGRGRLAVAAAGNYGSDRLHLGVELDGLPQRVSLDDVPWSAQAQTIVEIWSEPTTRAEVTIEVWMLGIPRIAIPLDASASDMLGAELRIDDKVVAHVSYGVEYVKEHRRAQRTVVLEPTSAELPAGARVVLRFEGRGSIDAWLSQSDYRYGVARFGTAYADGWISGDSDHSLTVPATAPRMIAVGAYTTRATWVSEDAGQHEIEPLLNWGELSLFSSRGPTLDPAFTGRKPDISAPGSVIVSARAIGVGPGAGTIDSEHLAMQGTSMAAPHVAGALALVLEANPNVGPKRARRYLRDTARRDSDTGVAPSDGWGHGKLNVALAVKLAEAEAPGCASLGDGGLVWWGVVLFMVCYRRRRDHSSLLR